MGFRGKNRQSLIDGGFCQQTRNEQYPLTADTTDQDLLFECFAHSSLTRSYSLLVIRYWFNQQEYLKGPSQ
jgi:hypothetical protein